MNVGAVIPGYNVGARLGDVLSKTKKHLLPERIFVVDDGSSDNTARVAESAGVVVFRHIENQGKGEALKSGFRLILEKGLDAAVTLDGDGQHDPDRIPEFIRIAESEGKDIVIGIREFTWGIMPIDRLLTNMLTSRVTSAIAGKRVFDTQSGYRLIRADVLREVKLSYQHYETESELLIRAVWAGFSVGYCPIPLKYEGAESHIRKIKDSARFIRFAVRMTGERIRNRVKK